MKKTTPEFIFFSQLSIILLQLSIIRLQTVDNCAAFVIQ